jgi:hypothetical protein
MAWKLLPCVLPPVRKGGERPTTTTTSRGGKRQAEEGRGRKRAGASKAKPGKEPHPTVPWEPRPIDRALNSTIGSERRCCPWPLLLTEMQYTTPTTTPIALGTVVEHSKTTHLCKCKLQIEIIHRFFFKKKQPCRSTARLLQSKSKKRDKKMNRKRRARAGQLSLGGVELVESSLRHRRYPYKTAEPTAPSFPLLHSHEPSATDPNPSSPHPPPRPKKIRSPMPSAA